MTPQEYSHLKDQFFNLTGKKAEDNLEAFFSYTSTIVLMDMKDILKVVRANLPNPNPKIK